jgi:hypothetical protein
MTSCGRVHGLPDHLEFILLITRQASGAPFNTGSSNLATRRQSTRRGFERSAIFVLTYAGVLLGRIPGLRLDRSGIALSGAALMLAIGALIWNL